MTKSSLHGQKTMWEKKKILLYPQCFQGLVLQTRTRKNQDPYSPTILKNILCLFIQDL